MAEAKMVIKLFYGIFAVFYGYNFIDVIIDKMTDTNTNSLLSESAQTGFAIGGLIFLFFKIVNFVLQMDHKRKMNKLNRISKLQEIKHFKEMNDLKEKSGKKGKKK